MSNLHQSVLLKEVIENLINKKDGIYIDATFGRGGHTRAILEQLNQFGKLLAIDKDPEAIQVLKNEFGNDPRIIMCHGSFEQLEAFAKKYHILGKVEGILLDLGVSSPQLDEASRGFSFLQAGPLDMRMDTSQGQTAADFVNEAKESEIAWVLKEFGEERFAKRIAGAIIREREQAPILTTDRLASIVAKANPAWEKHKHPATRSFQAIRIFINDELNALSKALSQSLEVLAVGGRLAVISFHSLEDRIVKRFCKIQVHGPSLPKGLPIRSSSIQNRLLKIRGPIIPSDEEIKTNPRARSAKLRVMEKIR